ncbi:MAG: energy transducer TonB [Enterobacterales bacterium]|nr:energy transducer TonB [Enterobacterales bacterium]
MQNHDGTISLDLQPKISQADKLLFCFFLAVAFHALLLFGIGFSIPDLSKSQFNKTFNVVLAQFDSKDKPDKADFIGQADQMAGGESDEKLAPSAIEKAQFNDPDLVSSEMQLPPASQAEQSASDEFLSSYRAKKLAAVDPTNPDQRDSEIPDSNNLELKNYQLSGLIANLDNQQVNQANKAKRRQISAAIHRSSDALYLDSWRRKIEMIGNQNYPEAAKVNKIYGNLTMKVAINKNGTIHSIEIVKTSGKKLLDDAAIRIVRLAAPFNPLTEEMKKDTDILEIIRIWRFQADDSLNARDT